MKENQIKGVMTELIEKKNRKSSFEVFLSTERINQKELNEDSSTGEMRREIYDVLQNAKREYGDLLNKKENIDLFKRMSELETTIIQSRCAISTVTKLTQVNQKRGGSETSYVVARAPFYNPDTIKPEIRAYLGKTENFELDLTKLSNDKQFMDKAEQQIVSAMKEVMANNKTLVRIKKSTGIKQLVTTEGGNQFDLDDTAEINMEKQGEFKKQKWKYRSPYSPNPADNPGPGSLSLLINKKNKKKG